MAEFSPDDERVDELNTLQSIYPELVLDLGHPPVPTARIELPVALEKPLSVIFDSGASVQNLSYLPPLIIDIILSEGYPAERPPTFNLTADPPWLPDTLLEQLKEKGHALWEEYGGMQMLFAYISFLEESARTAFGAADSAPDGVLKLPDTLRTAMLDLNEKLGKELFDKGTFDCGICLEPKKGAVCHRMRHCGHVFCKACLQDYYNNCIKEGDVNNVKCLSPDCGKTGDVQVDRRKKDRLLSPKELLQIPLELETVKRYAQIKRKKRIESDPAIAFCPRKWCQGAMRTEKYPKIGDVSQMEESDIEDDEPAEAPKPTDEEIKFRGAPNTDRLVVCEDCSLAFCKVCLKAWHGDLARCINREEKDLTEEDQASLDYILKNTSPCPTCSVPCSKSYGCNHMTCFQCKTHFCYLCGAWLEPENPYKHFNNNKNKTCFQRLMDGAMGDQANGEIRFGGRRGAEQEAEFWEREALRIQMEELE